MLTLHLGVIDINYSEPTPKPRKAPKPHKGKPRKAAKSATTLNQTTGDIAEILENKYHVMGVFAERHMDFIAAAVTDALAGTLESLLMGAPAGNDPFGTGTAKIEQRFRTFLDAKELDGLAGIPTQASLDGVDHRMKDNQGEPGRPSFIDTGQYQASFKSWLD